MRSKVNKENFLTKINEAFNDIIHIKRWHEILGGEFWDGQDLKEVTKNYKISICTNAMNRLEEVKGTFLKNIEDNIAYDNVEFVLLNYGSNDGLDQWASDNLRGFIKDGIVNYYYTSEPKHYSMAHSKNMAIRLSNGDVATSVDADNFINSGFAEKLNYLANQQEEKSVFVKGKQRLRGRIGFWREEFISDLGGYDELMTGYGFEDYDILYRSLCLGFKLFRFGGEYFKQFENKKHRMDNYKNRNWKYTERLNKAISAFNITYGFYKANLYHNWGAGVVTKNFNKEIII